MLDKYEQRVVDAAMESELRSGRKTIVMPVTAAICKGRAENEYHAFVTRVVAGMTNAG